MSGAVVAAVVARARRQIVTHFTDAGATRPEAAVAFTPGGRRVDRRVFDRMVKFGAVREVKGGLFYLDEKRLAQFRTETLARVLGIMGIAGLAAAAAIAFGT